MNILDLDNYGLGLGPASLQGCDALRGLLDVSIPREGLVLWLMSKRVLPGTLRSFSKSTVQQAGVLLQQIVENLIIPAVNVGTVCQCSPDGTQQT